VTPLGVAAVDGTWSQEALGESVYLKSAPVLVGVTIDVRGTLPPIWYVKAIGPLGTFNSGLFETVILTGYSARMKSSA